MFFIAYTFKGQMHVCAGQVKPLSHSSRRTCADPGIFVRGVQVSLTKKALTFFFFSPQLILQKSNGQFKRNLSFFIFLGSRGGPTFSGGGGGGGGGVQLFPGGSNCLFPIETHIICDFPGGVRTPCPLLWIRTCRTSAILKYFLSPETQILQREPARLEKSRLRLIASVREN